MASVSSCTRYLGCIGDQSHLVCVRACLYILICVGHFAAPIMLDIISVDAQWHVRMPHLIHASVPACTYVPFPKESIQRAFTSPISVVTERPNQIGPCMASSTWARKSDNLCTFEHTRGRCSDLHRCIRTYAGGWLKEKLDSHASLLSCGLEGSHGDPTSQRQKFR